jgi:hypothetical protein
LIDAPVPGLSELDARAPELEVGVQVSGDGRRVEVVEGHEEPDGFVVSADEVLQQEEVNIAVEILEEGKEAGVPAEGWGERAVLAPLVAADALQGQVHPVGDLAVEPSLESWNSPRAER